MVTGLHCRSPRLHYRNPRPKSSEIFADGSQNVQTPDAVASCDGGRLEPDGRPRRHAAETLGKGRGARTPYKACKSPQPVVKSPEKGGAFRSLDCDAGFVRNIRGEGEPRPDDG